MKRESRRSLERSIERQSELIRQIRKEKYDAVAQIDTFKAALNLQNSLMLCLARRISSVSKGISITKTELEDFSAGYKMHSAKEGDTVTIFVTEKGDDKDAAQADQHLRTETREGNGSI